MGLNVTRIKKIELPTSFPLPVGIKSIIETDEKELRGMHYTRLDVDVKTPYDFDFREEINNWHDLIRFEYGEGFWSGEFNYRFTSIRKNSFSLSVNLPTLIFQEKIENILRDMENSIKKGMGLFSLNNELSDVKIFPEKEKVVDFSDELIKYGKVNNEEDLKSYREKLQQMPLTPLNIHQTKYMIVGNTFLQRSPFYLTTTTTSAIMAEVNQPELVHQVYFSLVGTPTIVKAFDKLEIRNYEPSKDLKVNFDPTRANLEILVESHFREGLFRKQKPADIIARGNYIAEELVKRELLNKLFSNNAPYD